MNLQQWINQNYGAVHLNPDPPHGIDGQCVNLGSSWAINLYGNGAELLGATAWLIWQNFRHPKLQVVNKSGNNQPAPGDIVFFAPNIPQIGTGFAGHVDVCTNPYGSGFTGFDADWGTLAARYVNHPYTGVVGWFHPVDNTNGGGSVSTNEAINSRRSVIRQCTGEWHSDADILQNHMNVSLEQLAQDVWSQSGWKGEYAARMNQIYTWYYGAPAQQKDIDAKYAAKVPMDQILMEVAVVSGRSLPKNT